METISVLGVPIKPIFEAGSYMVVVNAYLGKNAGSFKVSGNNLPVNKGLVCRYYGNWTKDKHGRESFRVSYFEIPLPSSEKGVQAYLQSLKVGIGPKKAKTAFELFGKEIWNVIEHDADQLLKVKGISKKNIEALKEKLLETTVQREVVRFFGDNPEIEIPQAKIQRIYEKFGAQSLSIIKTEPYRLCEAGISFPMVDKLALSSGVPTDAHERIAAAIPYVLSVGAKNGNVCLPVEALGQELVNLLGLPAELVRKSMKKEKNKLFAYENNQSTCYAYEPFRQKQEDIICSKIRYRISPKYIDPATIERLLAEYEQVEGISFDKAQERAIRGVFESAVSVITGGPGTGKSTITKAILYIYEKGFAGKDFKPAVLLAPTGKAARRMAEVTLHDASTIHSAIKWKGYEEDSEEFEPEEIDSELFLIDESSMMDQEICSMLLECIPEYARIIFIGDPDQLPSVGCGDVLRSMIRSGKVPTFKLNVIFRQEQENPIVANSKKVNEGDTSLDFSNNHFKFKVCQTPQETFDEAIRFYFRSVSKVGIDNVMLLCPVRSEKKIVNVRSLNLKIQEKINPKIEGDPVLRNSLYEFRKGDRIMQIKNTDFAKNGDIGTLLDVYYTPDEDDPSKMVVVGEVEFEGATAVYSNSDFDHVHLAYCNTVHKAQGAEYKTVLMIVASEHGAMLKRNLLYTGITRAKENLLLIGQPEAMYTAIRDSSYKIRYSLLAEKLGSQI